MPSLSRCFDVPLAPFEAPGASVPERDGSAGTLQADAALAQRFDAFVAAHRDRAVSIAWRLLGGDGAAAEDVAQEAFVRAHRALPRFRDEAKLSTWFHRILVNEVRRHQRWRAVRRRWSAEESEIDALPDPGGAAAQPDPVLQKRIASAIRALPRGQREAFVLVHLEGFTISEAAAASGRAAGTMKSHLHRALARLRQELADIAPDAPSGRE